jgi:hypothetical protein
MVINVDKMKRSIAFFVLWTFELCSCHPSDKRGLPVKKIKSQTQKPEQKHAPLFITTRSNDIFTETKVHVFTDKARFFRLKKY